MNQNISDRDFHMYAFTLEQIFRRAGFSSTVISFLLAKHERFMWLKVFTPKSVDIENNYEYYEFLGDAVIEKFIKFYISASYPHLTSRGVGQLSRLSALKVSKPVLSKLSVQLGFEKLLADRLRSAPPTAKAPLLVTCNLLEDAFEAFAGYTQLRLEQLPSNYAAENLMYVLLSKIYEHEDMSTDRLVDYKTMLKELSDKKPLEIGIVKYVHSVEEDKNASSLYLVRGGVELFMGKCVHKNKKEAEKMVAEIALKTLQREGFAVKPNYDKIFV